MLSRFLFRQPDAADALRALRDERLAENFKELVELTHEQLRAEEQADAEAARYALTPEGQRALTRAFADEAVAFCDRLKQALGAEGIEQPDAADSQLYQQDGFVGFIGRDSPAFKGCLDACEVTPSCQPHCNRGEC